MNFSAQRKTKRNPNKSSEKTKEKQKEKSHKKIISLFLNRWLLQPLVHVARSGAQLALVRLRTKKKPLLVGIGCKMSEVFSPLPTPTNKGFGLSFCTPIIASQKTKSSENSRKSY